MNESPHLPDPERTPPPQPLPSVPAPPGSVEAPPRPMGKEPPPRREGVVSDPDIVLPATPY